MEKKITIIDKTFTPIVVRVSVNSAIYEDRGQQYGKQHLLQGDGRSERSGNHEGAYPAGPDSVCCSF